MKLNLNYLSNSVILLLILSYVMFT